jgi:hypothetical protein
MAKSIKNLQDVWEDSTPFDALRHQFGLKDNEVVKFIINKNPISITIKLISMLSFKAKKYFGFRRPEDIDAVDQL